MRNALFGHFGIYFAKNEIPVTAVFISGVILIDNGGCMKVMKEKIADTSWFIFDAAIALAAVYAFLVRPILDTMQ